MTRRQFITLLGGAVLARPLAAGAQLPARMMRIGYLGFGTAAATADRVEALRAGLRDLGYLEGKNIVIDFRWAEVVDRLRELAAELVRENVDVIFATSSTEVEVARQATTTIPIVFSTHFDPVGVGHVSSLARPGGNITGLAALQTEFSGKALEMLTQAAPHVKKIGVLWSPTRRPHELLVKIRRTHSARSYLHRQNTEGREACRFAGRASDQVRAGDQHEDRKGARAHDSAHIAGVRQRGD